MVEEWLHRNIKDTRKKLNSKLSKIKAGYAVANMPEGAIPHLQIDLRRGTRTPGISIARATGARLSRSLSPEVILCGHLVRFPIRAKRPVIKFALGTLGLQSDDDINNANVVMQRIRVFLIQ